MRTAVVLSILTALVVSGGSAQAAFPGDNGKIVVHAHDGNDYELYEAFAPGMVDLTDNDDFGEQEPEWNGEGTMLTAQCQDLGGFQPEICTYDESGDLLDTLTSTSGSYSPTWNRPGNRIAFATYDGHDNEIYKVATGGAATPVPITDTDRSEYEPEWSPNGNWILFNRTVNNKDRLFRMRPDGTSTVLLIRNFREGYAWAPDSKLIVFDRQVNIGGGQSEAELFSMKPNGSDVTRITFTENRDEYLPEWSPDGKWLVFIESPPSGSLRITKMRLSTGARTYNAHAEGNFGTPTWQPLHP